MKEYLIGALVAMAALELINLVVNLIIDRSSNPFKFSEISYWINTALIQVVVFVISLPVCLVKKIISKVRK